MPEVMLNELFAANIGQPKLVDSLQRLVMLAATSGTLFVGRRSRFRAVMSAH